MDMLGGAIRKIGNAFNQKIKTDKKSEKKVLTLYEKRPLSMGQCVRVLNYARRVVK
jgi:hypothetical protein